MISRRRFIQGAATIGIVATFPQVTIAESTPRQLDVLDGITDWSKYRVIADRREFSNVRRVNLDEHWIEVLILRNNLPWVINCPINRSPYLATNRIWCPDLQIIENSCSLPFWKPITNVEIQELLRKNFYYWDGKITWDENRHEVCFAGLL